MESKTDNRKERCETNTVIEYEGLVLSSCLMLRAAEEEQLRYIRRYYMERWQKEQAEDVHKMVEEAKKHIDESGFTTSTEFFANHCWLKWAERYICNRFQYMLRWEWVEAFSMLEDEDLQLGVMKYGGFQFEDAKPKAINYLIFVRNYARRYVNEKYV